MRIRTVEIYPFNQCESYMAKFGIPIFSNSICAINETLTLSNDGCGGMDAY